MSQMMWDPEDFSFFYNGEDNLYSEYLVPDDDGSIRNVFSELFLSDGAKRNIIAEFALEADGDKNCEKYPAVILDEDEKVVAKMYFTSTYISMPCVIVDLLDKCKADIDYMTADYKDDAFVFCLNVSRNVILEVLHDFSVSGLTKLLIGEKASK